MKLDTRIVAVILVAVGVVLVGAYQFMGHRDVLTPVAAAATPPTAGPLKPGAVMPPNHPMLPGAASHSVFGVNSKFTHFEIGNRNVKSIFTDGDLVWFGTSGGVIRYNVDTDKYRVFNNHVPGILSNGVFHVSKLGKRILVGTYGGGLSVYDPAADKWHNINIPEGLADQFVYDSLQAKNGDVWIATWSGANRIKGGDLDDPTKWESFTVENTNGGLPNPWVYNLDEGKDGTMWFATEYGLARYKDGKWKHWQHADGLGADYDEVKNAIEFTSDPGLASSHHAQQKVEQGLQGVNVAYNPNYIISLAVDNDGVVWCGTWGAGLSRFDGKNWRTFTTKDGLPANHIFMLYKDDKGHIWAGTSRGLARLNDDGESFSVMTTADGLFADNVFSMADAADGSVWIGSFGGVARITPN